ncbi:MAG TPA: ABC transporter permease [Gemmataceae bacterium]|nr:ABC transporter permease [Gemmataceae bacterium]
MNRWRPLGQLVQSRLREFYREPEALFWVYCFPLLLAVILGLAFSGGAPDPPTVDVENISDQKAVNDIVEPLKAAKLTVEARSKDECDTRLRTGKSTLTIIPGSSGITYRYDQNRADSVQARHWVDDVLVRAKAGQAVPLAPESYVTEPGSRYIDFLFPGLMGMNLMGGGLFGIGFVIVDMRVRKLFKRLLATPMRPTDFLLALLLSRLVFLIPEMSMLLLVACWGYGVPINGDPLALALVILAGVAAFDSLGLLIACRTEKTETASGLISLCMMPMYLLSGTFFSSKRFPEAVQPLIQALPLTQVNDALREVMLEGGGITDVAWRIGVLLAWTVVCGALALKWFRWR